MQYDLLIKNGYVVDYASAREGYFDVAVQNGMIAAVESSIGGSAVQELDASGKLVLPGLVDSHVHASAWLGGSYAHTMLVKAGVTSALDMSGPGTSVLELAREYGTGLNLATIEYVRPGHTVSSDDPSSAELQQLITKVQRQGSLGIKLLGGHYPLTVAEQRPERSGLRQSWELIRLFTPGQPLMVPISKACWRRWSWPTATLCI